MKLKQADWFLLIVLVFLGAAISFFIYLPQQESGSFVSVRIDGGQAAVYPLSKDRTETIQTAGGHTNTFTIKNGSVSMTEANCSDKTCVHTGSISQGGQTIVCLPHKVVLAISSDADREAGVDAVSGRGGGTR